MIFAAVFSLSLNGLAAGSAAAGAFTERANMQLKKAKEIFQLLKILFNLLPLTICFFFAFSIFTGEFYNEIEG
jgi:hypothetical protein